MEEIPQFIKFRCPSCSQKIKSNLEFAGKLLACPSCKEQIQIPNADGPKTDTTALPCLTLGNETDDPWANDPSSIIRVSPPLGTDPTGINKEEETKNALEMSFTESDLKDLLDSAEKLLTDNPPIE